MRAPHQLFERITIIGLGLIGSSIARAAHAKKLAETIVGCDENDIALTYARSHGFIDAAMNDLPTAVRDSGLVILATPPVTMGEVTRKIAPALKKGAIVMDTASVKMPVMQAIASHLPSHVNYIPAHPIAGSEFSGTSAGRDDLFSGKRIIVTPNEPLDDSMLRTINSFWSAMGAKVEGIPPEMHDVLYAYVSHLPQLLAFVVKNIVPPAQQAAAQRKFLRLGHSASALWLEIFLLNRPHVLAALDRYLDALSHIELELASSPQEEKSCHDEPLARGTLFPRIAASCLITTVMEAEKKAGFSYARYAGTGFADFTAPATTPPESDIETISGHFQPVLAVLHEFSQRLAPVRYALAEGDAKMLGKALFGDLG